MKQVLLLMGQLCLKLKRLLFFSGTLVITIALTLNAFYAHGVTSPLSLVDITLNGNIQEADPLNPGDRIPDLFWQMPLQVLMEGENSPSVVTLEAYRDKLIILDFWATWCLPCIKAFPKLNKLQNSFSNQIQIFSITDQNYETVSKTLKSNRYFKGNKIPIAINDDLQTGFSALFPKRLIPHVVAIKDNKVLVITGSDSITQTNIDKLLNGDISDIPLKRDNVSFNRFKPLLIDGNGAEDENFLFRSILTKDIPGVASGYTRFTDTIRNRVGYKVLNSNLKSAWSIVFPKLSLTPPNRVIYPEGYEDLRDSVFCYEVIIPATNTENVKDFVRRDLTSYFGLTANWIQHETICLVLKKAKGAFLPRFDVPISPTVFTENLFAGQPAQYLVSRLNWSGSALPPVINEVKNNDLPNTDPPVVNNVNALNKWLMTAGLQLVTETRTIEAFQFENF